MSNIPRLPHRDNMDMDMVQELQKMFPGKKIVFLGDLPDSEVTAEHLELVQGIQAFYDYSLKNGRCVDCGKKIEGFDPDDADATLPEGWNYLTAINSDEPVAWICSSCNKVDEDA